MNILTTLLLFQDLENTFDGWTGDLAHLTVLRESLSCYISAEDLSVLQERIELLHRQWDEICHQVESTSIQCLWKAADVLNVLYTVNLTSCCYSWRLKVSQSDTLVLSLQFLEKPNGGAGVKQNYQTITLWSGCAS